MKTQVLALLAATILSVPALTSVEGKPPPPRRRPAAAPARAPVHAPVAAPAARARHADRNKDGVITPRERRWEHRWETRKRSKVSCAWERRADIDGDGWVEPAEIHTWRLKTRDLDNDGIITVVESRTYWTAWRNVVTMPIEQNYDANGDGYLDWSEAQELLNAKIRIIETDGRAIVDTEIEREFDSNGDGVIDPEEAEEIREALEG